MVLHNPNNWHWVNKDATGWAREYLDKNLLGISAEENNVSAKISKVVSMEGDVDVSQRKGKVITLFDVQVKLEYEGLVGEEKVSGSITIPEVAHDTEEDEYVFDIDIHDEKSSKQPVKDLVRSKITPQLRSELAKIGPSMIAEHGKSLQHAADANPSSGFTAPKYLPHSTQTQAQPQTATTTTSSSGKANVNTTTVTADDEFRTTAAELYTTFTDPQRIAAFTRAAPKQFDGAKAHVGGKFSIFDGNVVGEFVTLEEPSLLVQRWRLAQWPEGHFSTQEIRFDQNDVDSVTVLRVKWVGVPVGQEDVVKRNWEGYYVRSIKQTFGFGTIL